MKTKVIFFLAIVLISTGIPAQEKNSSESKQISIDIGKLTVISEPDSNLFYPSFSKRSGEQGEVIIRLIIDETGKVVETLLIKSSSYPRLDRAAMEIGKQFLFSPYLLNGVPTLISTNLIVKFNLSGSENSKQQKMISSDLESNRNSNPVNWIMITKSKLGNTHFIDTESIRRDGNIATYLSRTNFPSRSIGGSLSSKSYEAINCQYQEFKLLHLMTYDDSDNKGKILTNFELKNQKWLPIVADSYLDDIRKYICK